MRAEDIDRALLERDAAPKPPPTKPTGPEPAAAAVRMPTLRAVPDEEPTRIQLGPHPAIPQAYQVPPAELLARPGVAPKLRATIARLDASARFGALLLGPSGCGKSSIAAWALRRWRAARAEAGECVTLAWLDALEATDAERRYRLGSGDPEHLAEAYRADWLVLDDVGLTSSVTLVQLVLARRYAARLPTIVTSGLRESELVQHIGGATVRRVVEFEGKGGPLVDCHVAVQR